MIALAMYDKASNHIGDVAVKFSSPMRYWIGHCGSSTDLPVQPPAELFKSWTIAKTETAFIIKCNNVEVLNYLFTDSTLSDCVPTWGGDVVEGIGFNSEYDKASDFYKAGIFCAICMTCISCISCTI